LGCGRRDYKERGRLSAMDDVGFVELVLNAEWYIWWERREKVHGENNSFDKELYDSPEEPKAKQIVG
jgi:hypothetical protein